MSFMDPKPLTPGALDAAVAGKVTTPGSAVATALTATIDTQIEGSSYLPATFALKTDPLATIKALVSKRDTLPVVVVSTGSSTPAGLNASTTDKRMVNLLAAAFQSAYPLTTGEPSPPTRSLSEAEAEVPLDPGVQFVNAAISGTNSATYLTALTRPRIAALNPSIILHQVGSNDYKNGVTPATYKTNLLVSIDDLRATVAAPLLQILVHPYQRYDTFTPAYPWSDYRDVLQEIAEMYPDDVAFIDISPDFYRIGIPSTDPLGLMDADKIHMTDTGHTFMADLLRERLGVPTGLPEVRVMVPFTSDSFTRADAATVIGSTTDIVLGGTTKTWLGSTASDGFAIVSNSLRPGATAGGLFVGFALTQPDQSVSLKLTTLPTAGRVFVDARRTSLASSNDYYRLAITSTTCELRKSVAATLTTALASFAVVSGDTLELQVRGATLTVYKNGVAEASVTDTSLTAGGHAGIARETASAGFVLDDIVIKTI